MGVPVIHDPSELFEEDVLTDGQATISWSDVDRPESLPENADEATIDLAEWMIRTGGVRSGFGHHEEVRRSMQDWAPDRDEDDPNDYRRAVYQMGPAERNGRALQPEVEDPEENPEQALEDRLQKADTILAWARSEFPDDVFLVRKDEWVENTRDKWESEIQDAIRVAQGEAFAEDPPAEYNGWERFESDKPDVELAYRAEVYGDPAVAAVYDKEGVGTDVAEFRMEDWQEAETANDAKVNRVLFDPTNEAPAAGDLEMHLRQFDADPLTYDPTQEFTDDRPDQDTLGTADATQHREPTVVEGSDEFADDRDHDEPEGDASSQASLGDENIEGQANLTGGQAAKGPEWEAEDVEDLPYDPTDKWGPTMDEPIPVEDRAGHDDPPEVLGEGWQDWLQGGGPDLYDDLTLEEELEEAGLSGEDLFGAPEEDLESDDPEDVTIPESLVGWDLAAEEDGFYSWIGDGGSPPAAFDRDETVAKVTAQSHGGRWKHRWSTKVRFEGPAGPDDEERSTQSTIASHKLTRATDDDGYAVNRARAIESAVDWMRDNPSTMDSLAEENESSTESENADREALTVEFGDVDLARNWHEDLPTTAHTGQYDRRHKTLEVFIDEVDERTLERMQADAADSRLHETQAFGQEELTDTELDTLKERDSWNHRKLFTAQSVKALFLGHGIGNWMEYYDPSLTTDEHRAIAREQSGGQQKPDELQRAGSPARHGGNETRDRDPDDPGVVRERVKSTMRALGHECDHALNWCEEGDDEACSFLIEECDWTESEVKELAHQVEEAEQEMDQLAIDDGGRIDPGTEIDASNLPVDEGGEIPGFAMGTLKRAWTGYSVAVRDASEYLDAAEEFEECRAEAERYAQIVNEVRQRFGQEPMSFDRLGELNEVVSVELLDAPTNESNNTGFRAALEWSRRTLAGLVADDPYDPSQEIGGEARTFDLEKALELHSTRSENAQEMDESIQARDQVTDFDTWAEAPNMMDFVGVDDLESTLGLSD